MTIPQPGDFAVVSAGGLAGPVVGAAERWLLAAGPYSEYQHAFIYTGLDGDKAIIQAEPAGADWAPLTVHAKTLWSTGKLDLTHYQRGRIVGAAQRYIGTPYSFLDYLAIGLHRLRIPIPHLKAYIADTGHMICSALVDRCYQNAGVQLFDDHRWNGYVTPAALARRIS
jgi:cell wall-associated NlpC family hydrolase